MPEPAKHSGEPLALYELELSVTFAGSIPERYNRAAPEATRAQFAAVEAVRNVLREHGFIVDTFGHGSRRIGTHLPPVEAVDAR